jgi:shikimate dehydrogenase
VSAVAGNNATSREGKASALPETVLVGLVGRGIGQSRSPRMHEAEGAHFGLRYVYRLLDTDLMGEPRPGFEDVLRAAEIAGFAGVNVTYPYKREAIPFLDELSETARTVGAVNTIVLRDGKRFGHNTDCWGFRESFRRGMEGAARDRVLLLGAGGAGGAVANALLDERVGRLLIADTDREAAAELCQRLAARAGADRVEPVTDVAAVLETVDGVVNATPVGMAHMPGSPVPLELLTNRLWVADIVYFPIETELLRAARERGCRCLPGAGMAVFQAVRAFELFTGLKPDHHRMKATFDAFAD